MRYRPTLLIILDGWGVRHDSPFNAIALARTPNMTSFEAAYPFTTLEASGEFVGLPAGLMGNSEVGHLNIGAGRVVYQDIVRISRSIQDGSFFQNEAFLNLFHLVRKNQGKVHLLGLLSNGGVHSAFPHLLALVELAAREKMELFVHAFLDGRDSPPKSALPFIQDLEKAFAKFGVGKIATLSGRYFAMDRDKRWERLEKAYRALVLADGLQAQSATEALAQSYERGESDEFVQPTVIFLNGKPVAQIERGDGVIFFNFRADRARQLTAALTCEKFSEFSLPSPEIAFCSMTQYDSTFKIPVAFPPEELKNTLSEVWSKNGLSQFHTAETEKYAHVTYFFGGGREMPFPGEDRFLVPSPKVATYDLKPEMSAREVTEVALSQIREDHHDGLVMNFANADMVGHTGNLQATIKAVEVVDECVGRLVAAVLEKKGLVAITADHGNAELLLDQGTGQPHTAHTGSPVPFLFMALDLQGKALRPGGVLADIAPTILEAQGLEIPSEMTGNCLLDGSSLPIHGACKG